MAKSGEITVGERHAALRKIIREMSRKVAELQEALATGACNWDMCVRILMDIRGLSAIADELMPPERF